MTTDRPATNRKSARKPLPLKMLFLFGNHAVLSGAFLVCYLTGDEDTYGMHQFAGYTVLAALALRVVVGLLAPAKSPLGLPRPSLSAALGWLGRVVIGDARARGQRSPLLAWMAVALIAVVGVAGLTGAVADYVTAVEHLHKEIGEFTLTIIIAHIALVVGLHVLKNPPTLDSPRRLAATRTESTAP